MPSEEVAATSSISSEAVSLSIHEVLTDFFKKPK